VSALTTEKHIQERANRASKAKFEATLASQMWKRKRLISDSLANNHYTRRQASRSACATRAIKPSRQLGLGKRKFTIPDNFDTHHQENIINMFYSDF
jgi:hypothetical protein